MSFGPEGAAEEEHGKMLNVAPESTKNYNLLCLSFKNNNPEPCEKDIAVAVFISVVSSRCGVCFIGRAHCFPASGKGKCICKIYAGIYCDTSKFHCHYPESCSGVSVPGHGGMVSGGGCPGSCCGCCGCRPGETGIGPGWAVMSGAGPRCSQRQQRGPWRLGS